MGDVSRAPPLTPLARPTLRLIRRVEQGDCALFIAVLVFGRV